MALSKQAKILTKKQVDGLLWYVGSLRQPLRNRTIVLLSVRAGLRAKEIAGLKWSMITDAEGKISTVGGSLRDVQALAGHSSLAVTQRYIEGDGEARVKVVELV